MGLRGPKPQFTPEERVARRRERNRVRHWTAKGLPAPPLGTARAVNGSSEAQANEIQRRRASSAAKRIRDRELARAFLHAHKLEHPCVGCGASDPRVLAFDHRDKTEKTFEISHGLDRGFPIARLAAEIAKCDVRCANCHAIRTREQEEAERVW